MNSKTCLNKVVTILILLILIFMTGCIDSQNENNSKEKIKIVSWGGQFQQDRVR